MGFCIEALTRSRFNLSDGWSRKNMEENRQHNSRVLFLLKLINKKRKKAIESYLLLNSFPNL